MSMLIIAIICFALAIIVGFSMFVHLIQDRRIPRLLPFLHGPLAVTGIILLFISSSHLTPFLIVGILFIFAALGGLTMFYKDMTGKKIPKILAIGHFLLAFTAFIFLGVFAFIYHG